MKMLNAATFALAGLLTVGFAGNAMAETQWNKNHPRRHEVNHRLNHQNNRIDRKEADGKMNRRQAAQLHHEDHQIRQEERDMASQDGGHITKSEQHTLNQQENAVSQQIRHE